MRLRVPGNWASYALITAMSSGEGMVGVIVPPFLHERGLGYSTIGLIVSLLGIAALISRLPVGVLYRRERGRTIMAVALGLIAASALLYPVAPDALTLGLVRFMNGLAIGTATTVNMAMYMENLTAGRDKARAMGLYGGSLAAGFGLGNVSGGIAADLMGYDAAFRAAIGFVAIAFVLLFLDRSPRHASRPAPIPPLQARSISERFGDFRRSTAAFATPKVGLVCLMAFFLNAIHQLAVTFFPLYGISVGLSLTEVGIVRGSYPMIQAVARPLAAVPISRFGYDRSSSIGITFLALGLMLVPLVHTFLPMLILFAFLGSIRAVALVANSVAVADLDDSRVSRGMSSAVYNGSKDIGSMTGPVLAGAVAAGVGLTTMFVLLPMLVTTTFVGLASWIRKLGRVPAEGRQAEV